MSEEQVKIPAGIYKAKGVAGSQQFTTSKNGTDTMAIDLEIPALARRLQTFVYLSPKAIQFAVERLRALGWDGSSIVDANGIDKNEVNVSIAYEMYDGKERMKVEIMTGGGRVEFEPMAPDAKRQLAARVAALMGTPAPSAAAQPMGGTSFPFGANAATPSAKAGF